MQRGYNLAHLVLAGVIVLGLTPLMVVLHGLFLLLPLPPQAKSLQCGDGSNRVTDNINYRLFLSCIEAAFENKRRVDPLFSIRPLESDIL